MILENVDISVQQTDRLRSYQGSLPNFLVIGAPRAGTTWLEKNLKAHPEIFTTEKKEIHFFDKDFDKGVQEYSRHFEASQGFSAIGEATPAYLHTPEVPSRIKTVLGDVKMILTLRNPTDRLYSRYWNSKAKFASNADLSFEDKVAQKPEFVSEGFYDEHLNRYFSIFPRHLFHFIYFEDIDMKPDEVMKGVYKFLGVDPSFKSPISEVKINAAANKGSLGKSKLNEYISKALRRFGFSKASYRLQAQNLSELPSMDKAVRERFVNLYRPHNKKLGELLGTDLSQWDQ